LPAQWRGTQFSWVQKWQGAEQGAGLEELLQDLAFIRKLKQLNLERDNVLAMHGVKLHFNRESQKRGVAAGSYW